MNQKLIHNHNHCFPRGWDGCARYVVGGVGFVFGCAGYVVLEIKIKANSAQLELELGLSLAKIMITNPNC